MGYELNRLMQGYGVSMPALGYAGVAAPGAAPVAPVNPTPTQAAEYAAALEAYNAKRAAYDADRAAFDAYKQDYLSRINPAAIYDQPQFNTGPVAARAAVAGAPTATGVAEPAAPTPVAPTAAAARALLAPITYPSASAAPTAAPAADAAAPVPGRAPYSAVGFNDGVSPTGDPNDGNAGWGNLTLDQQAQFYAQHPTLAAITQLGQTLFGYTTLGALQNAMYPDYVAANKLSAKGLQPSNYGYNQGLGYSSLGNANVDQYVAATDTPGIFSAPVGGVGLHATPAGGIVGGLGLNPSATGIGLTTAGVNTANPFGDSVGVGGDSGGYGSQGETAPGGADFGSDIGFDSGPSPSSDSGGIDAGSAAAGSGSNDLARGGRVRRKYAEGGGVEVMADKYGLANPTNLPSIMGQPAPQMSVAPPPGAEMSMVPPGGPEAIPAQPAAAAQPAAGGLEAMLARYSAPQQSVYAAELKAARTRAQNETDAFNKMLERAMTETGDSKPSKAELYFRLAAAFGAPTKTGAFTESLSAAGKEMAEQAKATREAAKADRAARLQLGITGAKARMEGARDELTTLRTLAGEEMRDARALTTKVMEQYIKSGEPESAAGKQAKDEGLKPGTPEYQARVKTIADQNVERQTTQIQSMIAQMGVAQAQLALAQGKFGLQQEQATKLTPAEVKLKSETEDALSATDSAMSALKQAYALNPNAFTGTLGDRAQRAALERTQGDNPRVVATRTMENLLKSQALAKLKDTFPGAISNDERKALEALQGIDSFSVEERGRIIRRAYESLQSARARQAKRLNEIRQGLYRDTTPAGGIE